MVAKRSESSENGTPDSGGDAPPKGTAGGSKTGEATRPMLDLEFVRGLIEAVDGSGIDSLEITRAGTRVKISKTPPSAGAAPTYFAAPQAHASQPQPSVAAAEAASPDAGGQQVAGPQGKGTEAEAKPADDLVEVTSPMVGTFYRAPAPEAPPYVEVGSRVTKGQTLCILEAMKLMNELEAEVDGVVREILVENAEPVEYGQSLFRIDPNG